ncbi:hypothetical protein DCAR_0831527 [Daucus carota subsp. sativus]|uniref:Uncharacterized protein n=1 Tax=Daucus carota subsp. sativus TaxID=79200 RepID=A0A175YMS6_DAUCS|nr:hypothetical protein DCAR_0831527 [Daucus carota subsp. sativus]
MCFDTVWPITCSTKFLTQVNSLDEPRVVEPMRLPTIEEVRGQDIWNNCDVRGVTTGVMGLY